MINLTKSNLPLMEWKDEYCVSIYEIDVQRKKLFDQINQLNYAIEQERGNLVLGNIIKELFLFVRLHFWTEEKYFGMYNCKDIIEHKEQHQLFVTVIKNFRNDFNNGNVVLPKRVLHFLKEWLKNHVLVEDMKIVHCFEQIGLN